MDNAFKFVQYDDLNSLILESRYYSVLQKFLNSFCSWQLLCSKKIVGSHTKLWNDLAPLIQPPSSSSDQLNNVSSYGTAAAWIWEAKSKIADWNCSWGPDQQRNRIYSSFLCFRSDFHSESNVVSCCCCCWSFVAAHVLFLLVPFCFTNSFVSSHSCIYFFFL